ncbi:MAG TPA: hypothetical protein VM802_15080 [Chitinophaga sp.]|nr:hypothetical protein [Chitinophaga sp.]HVI46197.1 hypothetical protein [Chitinophaga sp.]
MKKQSTKRLKLEIMKINRLSGNTATGSLRPSLTIIIDTTWYCSFLACTK